jgi:hypothetical protein
MNSFKTLLLISILGLFVSTAIGQTEKTQLYDPMADAKKDIAEAVKKAKAENKHVFIQVGGNW